MYLTNKGGNDRQTPPVLACPNTIIPEVFFKPIISVECSVIQRSYLTLLTPDSLHLQAKHQGQS